MSNLEVEARSDRREKRHDRGDSAVVERGAPASLEPVTRRLPNVAVSRLARILGDAQTEVGPFGVKLTPDP